MRGKGLVLVQLMSDVELERQEIAGSWDILGYIVLLIKVSIC